LDDRYIASKSLPLQYIISGNDVGRAWKLATTFPPSIQVIYRQITADSIDTLYILLTALAGGALLTSFFSEDLTLDRDGRGRQRFTDPKEQSSIVASTLPATEMVVVERRNIQANS